MVNGKFHETVNVKNLLLHKKRCDLFSVERKHNGKSLYIVCNRGLQIVVLVKRNV